MGSQLVVSRSVGVLYLLVGCVSVSGGSVSGTLIVTAPGPGPSVVVAVADGLGTYTSAEWLLGLLHAAHA